MHDAQNKMFSLAADFVNYSSRAVFLTGKAGTGKTTFLKYIKQHTNKQTAVVAPTGVAAINAGGVTIHSLFQIPFTPYLPTAQGFASGSEAMDRHHLLKHIRMNRERREMLQKLELLIIDEISMVRCDVLDAIDTVLRSMRSRHNEPFGGVQVLYIGDMFQLPPVAGEQEWNLLASFYRSPYFFDSKVVQEQPPVYVELDKIYRQNEQAFIDVLNKVRNNAMDAAGFSLLESRYDPWFEQDQHDKHIVLTTHNVKADAINAEEMNRLKGAAKQYKAVVSGDFNDKSYPVDALLQLKEGAQVMFIKNDTDKRYFNGKIGVVTKLEDSAVFVQCKGEPSAIEVKPEKWENIRYTLHNEEVQQDVVGYYKQLPLRLAWAITIHKSQGLTFEKAVIDAGTAFAAGQVYVALSRCTALQGIVLKSRLTNAGLRNDERIVQFAQQKHTSDYLVAQLQESKKAYQKNALLQLFDFGMLQQHTAKMLKLLNEHAGSFNEETKPWFESISTIIDEQAAVAAKFQSLLQVQYQSESLTAQQQEALDERIVKALRHFDDKLQAASQQLRQSPATTDSKQIALAYNSEIKSLYINFSLKLHLFNYCESGFNIEAYNEAKKSFVPVAVPVNAYAGTQTKKVDSPHPELYKQLRQLRDKICSEMDVPIYFVAGSATLDEMARYLPQTVHELIQISGFGKVKTQQFGDRFLQVITGYCEANGLASNIEEKKPKRERKEKTEKKEPKTDTKQETYTLYKQHKTIEEIAKLRNFTTQTIEGHLAYFVQQGLISVNELVSREKIVLIEPVLDKFDGKSFGPLKTELGDAVSYGDIRLVLAWKQFEKSREEGTTV